MAPGETQPGNGDDAVAEVRAILQGLAATLRGILEGFEHALGEKNLLERVSENPDLTVARIELESTTYVVTRVASREGPPGLSRRQREVAVLMAEGLSRKEISERLKMSLRTVDTHRERVYTKCKVRCRVDLARKMGSLS